MRVGGNDGDEGRGRLMGQGRWARTSFRGDGCEVWRGEGRRDSRNRRDAGRKTKKEWMKDKLR